MTLISPFAKSAEGTVGDEALTQTVFIPLYIGSTAKKLLEILTEKLDSRSKATEKGLPRVQSINCYSPREKLDVFGDIHITPFIVDHSAKKRIYHACKGE